jgi:hypothetical protein
VNYIAEPILSHFIIPLAGVKATYPREQT